MHNFAYIIAYIINKMKIKNNKTSNLILNNMQTFDWK